MSPSTIAIEIGALAPRRRRRVPPSAYLAIAACVAIMAIMAAPLVFSFFASIESATEASSAPHYLPQTPVFFLQGAHVHCLGYQFGNGRKYGYLTIQIDHLTRDLIRRYSTDHPGVINYGDAKECKF